MIVGKLVVALIAIVAVALASKISHWVRSRSGEVVEEAGTGDEPGSPDRGPAGMKM